MIYTKNFYCNFIIFQMRIKKKSKILFTSWRLKKLFFLNNLSRFFFGLHRRSLKRNLMMLNCICALYFFSTTKHFLSLKKIFKLIETKDLILKTEPQKINEIIQIFQKISKAQPKHSCLIKCIAVKFILNKYSLASTIKIGVKRSNPKGIKSHAWIEFVENDRFLDRPDIDEYKVIHLIN